MIVLSKKKDCCGCEACVQACGHKAIFLATDEEGFWYPQVDTDKCVDCGLCNKVCPILNVAEEYEPTQLVAAVNPNEVQLNTSSSGGVFVELAKATISRSGVVFGATFDDQWNIVHSKATTIEELEPLKRSKYVQSKIGTTYIAIKELLQEGGEVLFVGTPCQAAGLKNYLRKPYDNLLLVEIACHGAPSPEVWKHYLSEITAGNKITHISFREKIPFGWHRYGLRVMGENNKALWEGHHNESAFLQGMINNLTLRPSCYDCKFKGGNSRADLKLADFWKVEQMLPALNDNKGVSLIYTYSDKGAMAMQGLSLSFHNIPAVYIPTLMADSKKLTTLPANKRAEFFRLWKNDGLVSKHIMELTKAPFSFRLKLMAARILGR